MSESLCKFCRKYPGRYDGYCGYHQRVRADAEKISRLEQELHQKTLEVKTEASEDMEVEAATWNFGPIFNAPVQINMYNPFVQKPAPQGQLSDVSTFLLPKFSSPFLSSNLMPKPMSNPSPKPGRKRIKSISINYRDCRMQARREEQKERRRKLLQDRRSQNGNQ